MVALSEPNILGLMNSDEFESKHSKTASREQIRGLHHAQREIRLASCVRPRAKAITSQTTDTSYCDFLDVKGFL